MSTLPTRDQVPQLARGPKPGALATSPGAMAGGTAGAGLTGKDIVRIFRKRIWLIILAFAICLAVAATITVLWNAYAPWYTARAFLEIVPSRNTYLSPSSEPNNDLVRRLVQSHVQMVKSDSVLNQALQDVDLKQTRWWQKNQGNLMSSLEKDIGASGIPNTNLMAVSMVGTDKKDIPEVVNAVAKAFVAESRKNTQSEYMADTKPLSDELNRLQLKLADIRNSMKLVRPEDIPNVDSVRNVLSVKVQALAKQLMDLEFAEAAARSAYEVAQQQQAQGTLAESAAVQQGLDADPILQSLRSHEVNLVSERQSALQKLGPEHRKLKDLESRIATVRNDIAKREETLLQGLLGAVMSQHEGMLNNIIAQLQEVQAKYSEANTRLREVQTNLAEMEQLASQEKIVIERIKRIENRLMELTMLTSDERGMVHIRQLAVEPRQPSMPKWTITMPVGAFLGLILGFGLAFLLELIDTSIKGPSDISRRMDMPLLGIVPHADDIDEDIEDLRLTFQTDPNSLISESFRQIRTTLLFSGPASQRRSLLVTSALPEEGRGTVALNLAASVARGGRSVLLVDANFRQPMVRELFKQAPAAGLSNALVGESHWQDIVCEVEPNLHVMSSGPLPPNPAELLGSDQMRQLISELSGQYDQVIFDGAPCLVVTDPVILSTMVDGVILVVRAGVITYGIVQRTRDLLMRVGAHMLGVVLNGVRVTAGGYLRKNYDTFYDYHEQSQLTAERPAEVAAK